jgi:hypothetical protein
VSAWCESEDQDAGARVTEARNRASPVGLVLIGAAFCITDIFAIRAETEAAFTGDDRFLDPKQGHRERFDDGSSHFFHDSGSAPVMCGPALKEMASVEFSLERRWKIAEQVVYWKIQD